MWRAVPALTRPEEANWPTDTNVAFWGIGRVFMFYGATNTVETRSVKDVEALLQMVVAPPHLPDWGVDPSITELSRFVLGPRFRHEDDSPIALVLDGALLEIAPSVLVRETAEGTRRLVETNDAMVLPYLGFTTSNSDATTAQVIAGNDYEILGSLGESESEKARVVQAIKDRLELVHSDGLSPDAHVLHVATHNSPWLSFCRPRVNTRLSPAQWSPLAS